ELDLARSPTRLHPDPSANPAPPPRLGQHTVEILRELHVDPEPLLAAGVAEDGAGVVRRDY
ncbi:MAG: hypothetical protein JO244_14055, partial [Solirubrobacterales bacterium]|nr:hypothetical protein [Solirubrobacterales bacterium]